MELTNEEKENSWHKPNVDRLETYTRANPQKVDLAFYYVAVDDLRRSKQLEGSKIPMEIKELNLVKQRLEMIAVTKPDIYERAKQSVGGKEVQSGAQIVPRGKEKKAKKVSDLCLAQLLLSKSFKNKLRHRHSAQ